MLPTLFHRPFDILMKTSQTLMHQRRICEYLGLACTHLRSFLCLPPAIRHRIYREAGLVRESEIDLTPQPDTDSGPITAELSFSHSLLLTCRTIYAESSIVLYSTNRFFIRYRDSQSLRALRNLTPHSLSALVHLVVHLNVTSCEIGEPCCKAHPGYRRNYDQHDKPLVASSRSARAILCEWQSTAAYIMTHINSSKLQLHFICDVEDLELALQAVEPLLNTRTLANCAIRLGRQPNPLLQHLACKTAIQAMGHPSHHTESPFRFLDLPKELRLQILEYTDLVTPLCEVEWNPEKRFFLRYSTWRCGGSWDCPPHLHRACRFRNCWEYTNIGSFCRRTHAAFSSNCHCWSPPSSLFLVCRALLEDAQAVFWMRNRFVITPSAGCNRVATTTPTRLEVSIFLMDVVPSRSLRFLRYLEVVFPPFEEDYIRPHEPAYQEWLRTIDHIKEQLCLPLLTLRIYMADRLPNGDGVTPFRARTTQEQAVMIFMMYSRTLRPFSKLNGLKRFFVHLAWPFTWYWTERLRSVEQRYERLVMGSRYDSVCLQKGEQVNSQWLETRLNSVAYS